MRYASTSPGVTVQACQTVNFGSISLNAEQTEFLASLNHQLIPFCQSLPSALQTGAVFAIQQYFTGFQLGNLQRFFTKFYAPSWTLLGWMGRSHPAITQAELTQAIQLQGMAYFLHMLDDHLSDGQISVSHLMLQLRTQAWMQFSQGAAQLIRADQNQASRQAGLMDTWIDRYFSGVHGLQSVVDLETYCTQFRQQLSTTLVLPMIVADRAGYDLSVVQESYEAFCIAWRLLDDLRDCQDDALEGTLSGIYYLMSPDERQAWLDCQGASEGDPCWQLLAMQLEASGVLHRMVGEIINWLAIAQATASSANLPEYSNELQQLAIPLIELFKVEQ
jgi:hypothetical protein